MPQGLPVAILTALRHSSKRADPLYSLAVPLATSATPCRVAVIIPTYNSRSWIDGCVASVLAQEDVDVDVTVVDNASSDDLVTHVRARWPEVRMIALERNSGYGASVNIGAEASSNGPVMALNADAELAPGCLKRLLDALSGDGVGVAAPKLLEPDGRLQPSAHRFPTIPRLFGEAFAIDRLPLIGPRVDYHCRGYDYARATTVDWATGAVLLFSRTAWSESGGFDPRYFMYAEEIDLQHRVRAAGFRVVLDPSAVAVHHGGRRPLPPSLFLLAHEGMIRFLGRGDRVRSVAVQAALAVTALTRSVLWLAASASPGRRAEAQRWSTMFFRVFVGSVVAVGRLLRGTDDLAGLHQRR
jgi:GT2 family glycosyltransferase